MSFDTYALDEFVANNFAINLRYSFHQQKLTKKLKIYALAKFVTMKFISYLKLTTDKAL